MFDFHFEIKDYSLTIFYGMHMGLVKDIVTIRIDDEQIDQYKMSVKDYLKLD